MPGPILYSTNPLIKLLINQKFRGDKHYVWCGETFDSSKMPAYAVGANVAPSSDPCAIFNRLKQDAERKDRHSPKIAEVKASLSMLATKWLTASEITKEQHEEIIYMVNLEDFGYWKPVLYVIPRAQVAAKLKLVPPAKRASFGDEYIIENLERTEFDIVEF